MSEMSSRDVVEALRKLRTAAVPFSDRAIQAEPDFTIEEMRALDTALTTATDTIATILHGEGLASPEPSEEVRLLVAAVEEERRWATGTENHTKARSALYELADRLSYA